MSGTGPDDEDAVRRAASGAPFGDWLWANCDNVKPDPEPDEDGYTTYRTLPIYACRPGSYEPLLDEDGNPIIGVPSRLVRKKVC